jgi:hypothetical protein
MATMRDFIDGHQPISRHVATTGAFGRATTLSAGSARVRIHDWTCPSPRNFKTEAGRCS